VPPAGGPPTPRGAGGAAAPADIPALAGDVAFAPIPVPPAGVSAEAAAAAATHAIDLSCVDWHAWFDGTGMPPVKNAYDASERGKVDAHAELWVADPAAAAAVKDDVTRGWVAMHTIAFMEKVVAISSDFAAAAPPAVIDPTVLASLDAAFHFSTSKNSELRLMWGQLAVRSGLPGAIPAVVDFLKSQGRMKVRYVLWHCVVSGCNPHPHARHATTHPLRRSMCAPCSASCCARWRAAPWRWRCMQSTPRRTTPSAPRWWAWTLRRRAARRPCRLRRWRAEVALPPAR